MYLQLALQRMTSAVWIAKLLILIWFSGYFTSFGVLPLALKIIIPIAAVIFAGIFLLISRTWFNRKEKIEKLQKIKESTTRTKLTNAYYHKLRTPLLSIIHGKKKARSTSINLLTIIAFVTNTLSLYSLVVTFIQISPTLPTSFTLVHLVPILLVVTLCTSILTYYLRKQLLTEHDLDTKIINIIDDIQKNSTYQSDREPDKPVAAPLSVRYFTTLITFILSYILLHIAFSHAFLTSWTQAIQLKFLPFAFAIVITAAIYMVLKDPDFELAITTLSIGGLMIPGITWLVSEFALQIVHIDAYLFMHSPAIYVLYCFATIISIFCMNEFYHQKNNARHIQALDAAFEGANPKPRNGAVIIQRCVRRWQQAKRPVVQPPTSPSPSPSASHSSALAPANTKV